MPKASIRIHITDREIAAIGIGAAVFAVFSNCLSAGFVWDDAAFVLDNAHLASWSTLPAALSESITAGAGLSGGFYRPLQTLTHFIDLQLWGTAPWGHHLTNILLHAAAAVSVFYWLAGLAPIAAAALATLLFSLHPLQTEAVAYISGRGDTLAVLFICMGLSLFTTRPRAALACALMALLSKESAVVFPALLWLQVEALGRRHDWRAYAPFWMLSAAYAATYLFFFRLGATAPAAHGAIAEFASHARYRFFTYLPTLPEGLRLWLWPSDLHHERSWAVYQTLAWPVWGAVAGLALWLAVAAYGRRRFPAVAAGLLWFVIATLPTSNLLIVINALFYDHWFIFPGLGLALLLTQLVPKSGLSRKIAISAGFVAICAAAAQTRELNTVWHDSFALNSYILHYEPTNAKIHNNLAAALASQGRWEEAIEHLRAAIALDDEYPQAHHNLGKAYDALNRETEAAAEFRRAIQMNPNLLPPRICLGWLELRQGRPEQAERIFNDALRLRPYAPSAWLGLARIRLQRGDRAGAIEELRSGRRWTPDDPRISSALLQVGAGMPAEEIDRGWDASVR
ncbi:MAG: tetratricopeptide repeat protein [Elusimicrobia bacterium]|nr:tetratricopeptide repeat protein [Elusimicrobiota bacterium]